MTNLKIALKQNEKQKNLHSSKWDERDLKPGQTPDKDLSDTHLKIFNYTFLFF